MCQTDGMEASTTVTRELADIRIIQKTEKQYDL